MFIKKFNFKINDIRSYILNNLSKIGLIRKRVAIMLKRFIRNLFEKS